MQNINQGFYTPSGYAKKNDEILSPTMEDYLEMIYRTEKVDKYVRVNSLANKLNVAPSSASKMVVKLKELGYLNFQPYGIIQQTQKGWDIGEYLFYRHNVLNDFFCTINNTSNELELVEQIEHFIDKQTLENIKSILPIIKMRSES